MTTGMQPYRPPVTPQRGWRVGPLEIPMNVAVSDGACLDATVRVDQSTAMDVAVGTGACLDGTVDISTTVNSYTDMLLADGSGGEDYRLMCVLTTPPTCCLLTAAAALALAPTLSVITPVTIVGAASAEATRSRCPPMRSAI